MRGRRRLPREFRSLPTGLRGAEGGTEPKYGTTAAPILVDGATLKKCGWS